MFKRTTLQRAVQAMTKATVEVPERNVEQELRLVLRELLPYARDGVRAMQKRMCGNLYPALLDAKLERAEDLVRESP